VTNSHPGPKFKITSQNFPGMTEQNPWKNLSGYSAAGIATRIYRLRSQCSTNWATVVWYEIYVFQ